MRCEERLALFPLKADFYEMLIFDRNVRCSVTYA